MKDLRHPCIFACLALGMASQVSQVLILRELLMVFHGNELSIGTILCAWMVWVGVGSSAAARIIHRFAKPVALLKASTLTAFICLPLTIYVCRSLRQILDVAPGTYLSLWEMIQSSFLAISIIGILLGAQFVILSRVWRELDQKHDTSGASKVYIVEAAGNMLGGLIFTFILVHVLNSFQTAVLVMAAMLLPVWIMASSRNNTVLSPFSGSRKAWLVLPLTAVLLMPAMIFIDEHAWTKKWQRLTPEHELQEILQSKHGSIAVLKRKDQYSFFQSGHLMFSTAGPETLVPGFEEQEAVVLAHFAMTQHPSPEKVLLIGGGLRGVLAEILKHPVAEVSYVELDPVLTRSALKRAPPATVDAVNDPRVNMVHSDARLYVKQARGSYDLIIVDAPDPATSVLNRFYTREFYDEAKRILRPGGVLATGLMSTHDLRSRSVANRNAAVYHTLASVFEKVLPVGDSFLFYFATDQPGQISHDPALLRNRFENRSIQAQGFSGLHFHLLLEDSQLRRVNWTIRNHGRSSLAHLQGPSPVPVNPEPVAVQKEAEHRLPPPDSRYFINSDFRPIVYFYTLMFWDEVTRSGQSRTLAHLLQVQFWWFFPVILFPVVIVAGLKMLKPGKHSLPGLRFAVLFTAFSTGFSTMVMQVALIFSFQSIYGFIYETVGLIIAMFMTGLAAGAYAASQKIKNKSSLTILGRIQLLMAAASALMALIIPVTAGMHSPAVIFSVFSLLTLSAGFINGIDFPLTAACYMSLGNTAEKSAGRVYATELGGACAGALVAGVAAAPVLGIHACFMLAALSSCAACCSIFITRR
ncbi:fused MFS/spermidine synthase [Desulfonatronovibrio magnus]|uniref:fused MFS/spermidine synthase n=1 Tax=Desulfonatronovibrio magnus TaxID=698827 RepID=UPI0005EB7EC4|nr:fused MFS/spermidine synthase [Desulfonatronovibrio magnus]